MNRNIKGLATLTTLAVMALTACGNQVPAEVGPASAPAAPVTPAPDFQTAPAEPAVTEWLKVTDSSPVPMPLDPYLASPADLKTIAVAKERAAASCMRRLGFTGWDPGTVRTWTEEGFVRDDFLTFLDPEAVAQSGYTKAESKVKVAGVNVPAMPKIAPTKDELKAFEGGAPTTKAGKPVPAQGCVGEGERKVQSDALPVDPLGLASDTANWAFADSRVRQKLKDWSACMADAGMKYQQPFLVKKDPRWMDRPATTPAGADEKKTGAQDAECQQKVNLVGTYLTIKQAHQKNLLDQHKGDLAAAKTATSKWVDSARSILTQPID